MYNLDLIALGNSRCRPFASGDDRFIQLHRNTLRGQGEKFENSLKIQSVRYFFRIAVYYNRHFSNDNFRSLSGEFQLRLLAFRNGATQFDLFGVTANAYDEFSPA